MFLSMSLAQVKAVEADKPVELQVIRAARDSLELCNNLLKTREDTPSPDEVGLAAMEGVQGFEGLGPDFGWEYLFPDMNGRELRGSLCRMTIIFCMFDFNTIPSMGPS
jgi:hypothetical protein